LIWNDVVYSVEWGKRSSEISERRGGAVVVDGSRRVVVLSVASCAYDGVMKMKRESTFAVNNGTKLWIPREAFIFANGRPRFKRRMGATRALDRSIRGRG
jgi:hypothetical protein